MLLAHVRVRGSAEGPSRGCTSGRTIITIHGGNMNHPRFTTRSLAVSVLSAAALLAALALTPAVQAAKPKPTPTPPPPPPLPLDGGTIYYQDQSNGYVIKSIAPDGSGAAVVAGAPANRPVDPSTATHDGARWFLDHAGTTASPHFADGRKAWELIAYREGGTGGVTLTDLDALGLAVNPFESYAQWTVGPSAAADGAVAWTAVQWADTNADNLYDTPVGGGIYRANVSFDGSGNISLDAGSIALVVAIPLQSPSPDRIDIDAFSLAPDGGQVVYTTIQGAGMRVSSVPELNPSASAQVWNRHSAWPDWSPDLDAGTSGLQTRIAFRGCSLKANGSTDKCGLWSILPSGADARLVLADKVSGKGASATTTEAREADWSPAGSHWAWFERVSGATPTDSLRRVQADGTNSALLAGAAYPLGWVGDADIDH
jgi:hypothetical protein